MNVTMKKPDTDLSEAVRAQMESAVRTLIGRFVEIGEKCVTEARVNGNYTDRTGNLRSSIGYVVAYRGSVVASSSFAPVAGATEGPDAGRALAERVASQYPQGLVLVLVAGMDYAVYVQDKGYNVLDSAEILADKLISQLRAE